MDGKTDMTKLIVSYRSFEKVPKTAHHKQSCLTQQKIQVSRLQLLFEKNSSTANYLTRYTRMTAHNLWLCGAVSVSDFSALDLRLQLTNITKEIRKISKEAQAVSGLRKTRFQYSRTS
jgi:hypothetical protein